MPLIGVFFFTDYAVKVDRWLLFFGFNGDRWVVGHGASINIGRIWECTDKILIDPVYNAFFWSKVAV